MDADQLSDRLEVQDLLTRMSWYLDHREWSALEAVFAAEVVVDYTQPFGGEVEHHAPESLVGRWREQVGHLDATQHVASGVLVHLDGDRAEVTANASAVLRLDRAGGPVLWRNGGTTRARMSRTADGWRIAALTLRFAWTDGDPSILQPPGPSARG